MACKESAFRGPACHRLAQDVARIEWAFVEAFDGAERDPLTLEQISTLDGDSRLALQPHLQLVALDFPVDDLVLNLHKHDKRQTSEAGVGMRRMNRPPQNLRRLRRRPTWLAAHRVDFSVYYLRLEARGISKLLPRFAPACRLHRRSRSASPVHACPVRRRPQLVSPVVHQLVGTWLDLRARSGPVALVERDRARNLVTQGPQRLS